jgi:hypothetical protein
LFHAGAVLPKRMEDVQRRNARNKSKLGDDGRFAGAGGDLLG